MNIAPLLLHLRSTAASFARADDGSATVWNLTWLAGFAIMGGLAIDSTNAWRHKTMLVSTADVSALAGSIDIPNPERRIPYTPDGYPIVKQKALEFAVKNMGMESDEYGSYMQATEDEDNDVYLGNWNTATRTFTYGDDPSFDDLSVNAVRVFLGQNNENRNNVQTTLLRFLGIYYWEINTTATAMRGIDGCYLQGMMSRDEICLTSNNNIYPGVCIHGEQGLNFRNNNDWSTNEEGQSLIAASSNGNDNIDSSNYNPGGLGPVARGTRYVPNVDSIPETANEILAGGSHMAQPQYADWPVVELTASKIDGTSVTSGWLDLQSGIQLASLDGFSSIAGLLGLGVPPAGVGGGKPPATDPAPKGGGQSNGCDGGRRNGSLVEPVGTRFTEPVPTVIANTPVLEENRIYYAGDRKVTLDGTIKNVIIITKGSISVTNKAVLEDVTLISLDDDPNGNDAISINGAKIGKADDCAPGGGVKIYSMGSIGSSSSVEWNGVMVVSGGTFGVAAKSDGIHGLAAFAAGNIKFAAQGIFGSADGSGLAADGSCAEGTPVSFADDAYRSALVE